MQRLTIQKIECVPLRMPLPRTYRGSSYFMTHRCTIITRVYTQEGVIGEVYNGDEFETQGEVVKIILDEIQPLVIGKDAFNIEGCWEAMRKPSNNILRDRKLAMCAQACVDSALWDAVGKALGVPLYKLWGGYADRLPVMCIAGYYEENKTLADFGREMEQIKASGYAGCKFKVGGRTPKEDAERVRVARKAAGDDFILTVDANQGWSLREAVAFSRAVEGLDIRWFEEPVHWPNDRLDMAAVRSQTGIPVCAGQSEISRAGCRDLMMSGAIDVCNFDASWGGGPTEWRRVAGAGRRPSPYKWAITRSRRSPRICSRRSQTAHIWKRFTRNATRCFTRSSPTARNSTTAIMQRRRERVSGWSSIPRQSRSISSRAPAPQAAAAPNLCSRREISVASCSTCW